MRYFFTKIFLSRVQTVFFVLLISAWGGILSSAVAYNEADLEACIVEKMLHADDKTTIGELKAARKHHLEGLKRLTPEEIMVIFSLPIPTDRSGSCITATYPHPSGRRIMSRNSGSLLTPTGISWE